MAAVPSQDEALHNVKRRSAHARRAHAGGLRAELRARLLVARPGSKASQPQLDWMERVIRYLSRVQARTGDHILRTVPQMAKGLGLPVEGLTVRQIRDRWEDQITNTLAYLEAAGYVDRVDRDLRRDDGQGIGIVVTLRAGVAQSVRASRKRPAVRTPRRPSCSFSSRVIPPPRGGLQGDGLSKKEVALQTSKAVSAQARGTRDRAHWSTIVRAALSGAALSAHPERGVPTGAAVLAARPQLAEAPADIVAREAWRLFGPEPSGDCRLSVRMAERLERASSQLERCGYATVPPGAAASRAAAIDMAAGDWRLHWPQHSPPRTLGGLACCLRRLAHETARQARRRREAARARRG